MENFNTMLNNEEGYTERSYCRKKVYPFSGHWSSVQEIIRIIFYSEFINQENGSVLKILKKFLLRERLKHRPACASGLAKLS